MKSSKKWLCKQVLDIKCMIYSEDFFLPFSEDKTKVMWSENTLKLFIISTLFYHLLKYWGTLNTKVHNIRD